MDFGITSFAKKDIHLMSSISREVLQRVSSQRAALQRFKKSYLHNERLTKDDCNQFSSESWPMSLQCNQGTIEWFLSDGKEARRKESLAYQSKKQPDQNLSVQQREEIIKHYTVVTLPEIKIKISQGLITTDPHWHANSDLGNNSEEQDSRYCNALKDQDMN